MAMAGLCHQQRHFIQQRQSYTANGNTNLLWHHFTPFSSLLTDNWVTVLLFNPKQGALLAHLSASPAADPLSRAVCEEGKSLSRAHWVPGHSQQPHPKCQSQTTSTGWGFSSHCRVCKEESWGEPVLLPRCCLCSAWEPLPASAEFPAARSASNLGKEKPSLAQHHPGNPAHPSPMPKLVFTASLRPGQWVLPSPAQRGMCIHRNARTFTELCVQELQFCTSQNLPWSCDFLVPPSGYHRRIHPDLLGCPLQPSCPTEPLTTKPNEALVMEWLKKATRGGNFLPPLKEENTFPWYFSTCTTTAGNTRIAGYRHGLSS